MKPKSSELLPYVALLSIISNYCNCITLLSKDYSYAQFPPWKPRFIGKLEFRFKTFYGTALLLYIEEKIDMSDTNTKSRDKHSFLQLSLENGGIRLVVQMGGEDFGSKKQRRFGANLQDLEWHTVQIHRSYQNTTVKVDNWSFKLVNTGDLRTLPVNSDVYVGGVPSRLKKRLVNGRLSYIPRFVGCIEDLAYSDTVKPVRPYYATKAEHAAPDCVDACKTHKDRNCGNGGKCINRFSRVNCNCAGTGFEGTNCTTPSLSAYFRGVEYLVWSPRSSDSTPSHHIIIRFKTYLENGILFATRGRVDFLIIELYEGKLRMAINLGGGALEIMVGEDKLNDHLWHKLEIKRKRGFHVVSIDDRLIKNGTTPGRNSNFDIPSYESLYFGGHKNARTLENSKAKQNFAGCMQHIFYNKVDILYKRFSTLSTQIRSVGYVQKGCPVVTTTQPATTTEFTSSSTSEVTTKGSTKTNTETKAKTKAKTTKQKNTLATTKAKTVVYGNVYGPQNSSNYQKPSLSKSQIAWITSGIIIGALLLVFTTACLVHRCKKRYNGFLLSSAMKNKDQQLRPNQRYKGERVVFLENATKEKLEKVTSF